MNYIIAGLIGILVWQIIGIIIYEASGENDDVFVFVLCVPVFILNIIGWCYKEFYFAWCKNNLNGYILYCNGVSVFSQVYMTDREAEKLYHEGRVIITSKNTQKVIHGNQLRIKERFIRDKKNFVGLI